MKNQMRVYTINKGQMEPFVRVWQEKVVPARVKAGFSVSGVWVNRQTNQFVWVVSYDGPKAWEEVEKAYYDSPERKAFNPDPSSFIARMETYFVDDVEYAGG